MRDGRPSKTRAISTSAAVSAALPAASGTPVASRAATTTTCWRERAGAPADHVDQLVAVVVEALALDREAAVGERGADLPRDRHVAGRPGAAVGVLGGDPLGLGRRLIALEQHVGGEPLRQRAGAALEREHHQHDREQCRHEGRPVDPGLDQGRVLTSDPTYNLAQAPVPLRTCALQMAQQAPRILLVDDEHSVQKLLASALRKDGYEVVSRARRPRGARPLSATAASTSSCST